MPAPVPRGNFGALLNDILTKLRSSLLLTIAATAVSFPYVFLQTMGPWAKAIARDWGMKGEAGTVFMFHFALLAAATFLCAVIGVFLAGKYNLPGFGSPKDAATLFRRRGAWAIAGGLILGYFLHDRTFYRIIPEQTGINLYPEGWISLVSLVLHTSISRETVFRFGFVTLLAGLFRGKRGQIAAVLLVAAFASYLAVRQFYFVGYYEFDGLVVASVAWTFLLNALTGMVYVRKGLWSAATVRACVDLRFLIYPALGLV